jgi:membrane protease YdiL (CAAX protease family)
MPTTWKHIAIFFALTILLLALVPVLSMLTGATMDFDAAAARATEKTGIEQTSNLITVLRLALAEPALWLLVLGSSIPSIAALIICGWTRRPGIKKLLMTFKPIGPDIAWKQALGAYALLLVLIPLCLMAVYVLRSVIPGGVEYARPEGIFGPGLIVALLTAAFLDQGGVLEELGWRGYAQRVIQSDLASPLTAALVVGVAWGLWHVPRDVVGGVMQRLGLLQYLFMYLPAFVAGTITTSIIAAYFMNRTGGSLLPAVMVHGLINDATGISGIANLNTALTPYHQITQCLPFLILSIAIIALSGRRLGRASDTIPRA